MATPSVKLLAACCLVWSLPTKGLIAFESEAFEALESGRDPKACECLPWSEVYAPGRMDCNRYGIGWTGDEFCGVVQRLNDNVCLQDVYQSPKLVNEVCFVLAGCETNVTPIPGVSRILKKTCTEEDQRLTDLSLTELDTLVKMHNVDAGCMSAYAAEYVDQLTSETTEEDLAQFKKKRNPTLVWSMGKDGKHHFDERWHIKGNQVFKHNFDPSLKGIWWRVECKEGCDEDAALPALAQQQDDDESCSCLPWAQVYGEGGLDCHDIGVGWTGDEFCGVVQNLHENVCLQNAFMTTTMVEEVCFVSNKCRGSGVTPISHGFSRKTCTKKDRRLTDMSLPEIDALVKKNKVDAGCIGAYAAEYVDMLTSDVQEQHLEFFKKKQAGTFIWSMHAHVPDGKDHHFDDRWHIKGDQIFVHNFDPTLKGMWWRVECKEGCGDFNNFNSTSATMSA